MHLAKVELLQPPLLYLMGKLLSEADYSAAASSLGVEVATIKAVAEIESRGAGFLPNGKPVILYEPHIFSRYTNRQFDAAYPTLSYPKWKPGNYGPISAQWPKFEQASELNREAAILACSWGKFQIMGFNYRACGLPSAMAFRVAMERSEGDHLMAFCAFVRTRGLVDELQRKDWAGFSRGYNGAGYAANQYDLKLARAYAKHSNSSNV